MPVPQRHPEADAEAAPADVDGLHQPRHHQGRGPHRPRRAGLLLRRSRRRRAPGAEIYYDIIKSDACVPIGHARERQPRHGVGVLDPPRPRRGDPPRPGGLRVLLLRGQRAGGAGRGARPLAPLGGVPGAARQPAPTRAHRRAPRPRQRLPGLAGIGTPDDIRAHLRAFAGRRRRPGDLPAAGRPQPPRAHLRSRSSSSPREVLPEFKAEVAEREARKAEELAPYIAARHGPQERGWSRSPTTRSRSSAPPSPRPRSTNPPPDRAVGTGGGRSRGLSATWRADQFFVRSLARRCMNSRRSCTTRSHVRATPISSYASPVPSRSCIARAVVRLSRSLVRFAAAGIVDGSSFPAPARLRQSQATAMSSSTIK